MNGAPPTPRGRIRFGPLLLDPLDLEGAAAWIRQAADRGSPAMVVTPNTQLLDLARRDPAFAVVLQRADLSVADGWPIVLGTWILGTPVPGRVAGIDLVERLLRGGPLRLAILGGAPGAAERLARRAAGRHEVVLLDPLPKGEWEALPYRASLLRRARRAAPQVTLVGIGSPAREHLAGELRAACPGPVICCGAAVDVLAGVRPRAPRVMRRAALEWLFRLALEPSRLGPRYGAAGLSFLATVASEVRVRRAA